MSAQSIEPSRRRLNGADRNSLERPIRRVAGARMGAASREGDDAPKRPRPLGGGGRQVRAWRLEGSRRDSRMEVQG